MTSEKDTTANQRDKNEEFTGVAKMNALKVKEDESLKNN